MNEATAPHYIFLAAKRLRCLTGRGDGGEIVENVPGQPDRPMMLRTGEFFWQDAGVTRAVHNSGTSRVELVEFELK